MLSLRALGAAKCGQTGLADRSRKENADPILVVGHVTRVTYENVTLAQNWERLKGLNIIPGDRDK